MAIKLITFDMAGTTVHDKGYVHLAFMDAHEKNGYKITYDAANEVMGYKKPVAIKMMLKSLHNIEADAQLIEQIHTDFVENMINFYQTDESVKEIEGVSEFFNRLHAKGIKIGLETGFSRDIADTIIKRLNWKDLIDVSCCSDEVEEGRPAPLMILENMKNAGVANLKEVAKAGDTPVDLQSGDNAHCLWNIGVLTGAYDAETLKKHPHTHILNSVLDIEALLE